MNWAAKSFCMNLYASSLLNPSTYFARIFTFTRNRNTDTDFLDFKHPFIIILSKMENNSQQAEKPKPKGMCCVCKPEKAVRDECFLMKSEEECKNEIELHLVCLRKEGFKV